MIRFHEGTKVFYGKVGELSLRGLVDFSGFNQLYPVHFLH
jgi:hypothetical protein